MRSASPLRRAISIPMRRNEVLHDSPLLEEGGCELPVPLSRKGLPGIGRVDAAQLLQARLDRRKVVSGAGSGQVSSVFW